MNEIKIGPRQKGKVFYDVNKLYSITLNPCDQQQGFRSRDRLREVISFTEQLMDKVTRRCCSKMCYTLYTELSEPIDSHKSESSRVHFHGVLLFKDTISIKMFLLYGYRLLCQHLYVNIDTITDLQAWINYCFKQQFIINKPPICDIVIPWFTEEGINEDLLFGKKMLIETSTTYHIEDLSESSDEANTTG
jgi:hypothetical protein